ncbi:MAG: tryptophan synthase subunit alpha [Bryobacteraceae bacterium]
MTSTGSTSRSSTKTRIGRLFEELRQRDQRALIAYLTAGDPSLDRTVSLIQALEEGGADLIELGVPFSDPIADGPVIQRACQRALQAGATLAKILETASRIRARSDIPLLLFSYLNPVLRYGLEAAARDAAAAGVDGCLLTDLSVEEAGAYTPALRQAGLDTVFLAAPTSTDRRLRLVAEHSSGFVYLVSRTGVTGERDALSEQVAPLVRRLRQITELPLAVGFGIARPEQAAAAAALADGVVVGSAFVRLIEQAGGQPDLERRLEEFARQLKRAIAG